MRALTPYRVLDIASGRGRMCGRVLADLGAEVIAVEPPGGDPSRHQGLFADPEAPDRESSLTWWFENRGKRSIVLDLETAEGRDVLLRLVDGADALIESAEPGWLEAHGLAPELLLARNPHLVITSITPFGRTGPHAHHAATDLTVAATTGEMFLTGDTDRAPVRLSAPQVFHHAGVEGAVHTLVALWHAQHTGVGQHVDVSAQATYMKTLMNAAAYHLLEGRELFRLGPYNLAGREPYRIINPCKDGYVSVLLAVGPMGGAHMKFLVDWAARDGVADPLVVDRDFTTVQFYDESPEFFVAVNNTLQRLFELHTKDELYQAAMDNLLLLAPVTDVADLRDDLQLNSREYFAPVEQHGRGPVAMAGPWAKLSATPLHTTTRAPLLDEHGEEVASLPARRPAAATSARTDRSAPFAGLKVLDLSWVGVGPMTAGYLANYGAEVIKIESSKRPDVLRRNPPFRDSDPGINHSHFHGDFNPNKRSVGLDLGDPRARDIAWKAIEWADVIIESFTPKALAGWGMDYAAIRERKPDMLMLSTCMQGQTGPRRNYRGFGNLMGGLAGFYQLTGWPDRTPAMIYGAYTDFISQRYTTSALVAALDHRRRTGEGQHIDVSQLEASLQLLGPELLAYETSGRVADRNGNRDLDLVPNVVLPCMPEPDRLAQYGPDHIGSESWVAISCADDAQWAALAQRAGIAERPEWRTAAGRRVDEDTIEALLAAWTSARRVGEIVALLQPHVAAAPVLGIPELHADPQLAHRGYWVPLQHPVQGLVPYSGMQATLSVTQGTLRTAAPCLGQHTWEVLEEVWGVDPDEIGLLLAEGIAEITG